MIEVWKGAPRRLALASLAVLCAAALGACGGGGSQPSGTSAGAHSGITSKELVIADYGGTTRDARADWVKAFEKATGVRVVFADANPAKVPTFAQQGRADWDLIDSYPEDIVNWGAHGLIEALPGDIPRPPRDLAGPQIAKFLSPGYIGGIGIAYNTQTQKSPPTSWQDFFDFKKYPGKRAIPSTDTYIIEGALLADGVKCDQLYPLDFARAYKKLDTLKGHTVVWDSYAQAVQYVLQGTASLAAGMPDGRAMAAKAQGFPIDFVWNRALMFSNGLVVLRDAPHKDAANAFLKFGAEHPETQAAFAVGSRYPPMFPAAVKELPKGFESVGTPPHTKQSCLLDSVQSAKTWDKANTTYAKWVAGL